MLVTREMIEKDPGRVATLVRAHVLSTRYLVENQPVWLGKAAAFGTPLPVLEKAASNIELAWDMDVDFIRKVQSLGERMQSLGIIQKQPDYTALVDLSFVQAVKQSPDVK
jgi:NitT/TauT family transport system substrate-binding protein